MVSSILFQFSSVAQSCPTLCDPMIAARQASLSITNSQSSLKLTSIQSVMLSSHLILGHPLLLLPSIPPSIRVFSNETFFCFLCKNSEDFNRKDTALRFTFSSVQFSRSVMSDSLRPHCSLPCSSLPGILQARGEEGN